MQQGDIVTIELDGILYNVELRQRLSEFRAFEFEGGDQVVEAAVLTQLHSLSAALLFIARHYQSPTQFLFDSRDATRFAIDQLRIISDIERDAEVFQLLVGAVVTTYFTGDVNTLFVALGQDSLRAHPGRS